MRLGRVILFVGFLVLGVVPGGVFSKAEVFYDLRAGDHLVYRVVLRQVTDNGEQLDERAVDGKLLYDHVQTEERAEWEAHVLVISASTRGLVIGIQRNRQKAELLRFDVAKQDRRENRRPSFERSLADRDVFAEANIVGPQGYPLLPWVAAREWPSKMLFELHEVVPLPPGVLSAGYTWTVPGIRNFNYEIKGRNELDGEYCLLVDAAARSDEPAGEHEINVSYWFSPSQGVIRKVHSKGGYRGASFEWVEDDVVMELVEKRRDEDISAWLADPRTREGIIEALMLPGTTVDTKLLYPVLQSSEPRVQTRILGVIFQKNLVPPSFEVLSELVRSQNPRVRTLAVRLMDQPGDARFREVIDRAEKDTDYFVREAAKIKKRLFLEEPTRVIPFACNADHQHVPAKILRRTGIYLDTMESPGLKGWPVGIQIPVDYRGDEPFPVVIHLSGNGGSAIEGIQVGHEGFDLTGYLVFYPQAGAFWWKDGPVKVVQNLLIEIRRRFNVDSNRIYLTGWSNGGTGTLHFSSLWPQDIAAAVSTMGAGFWGPEVNAGNQIMAENLAHVPILFLHGERDRTIPARESRESARRLTWRQAPVEEYYFKDLGHEIIPGVMDEGKTLGFLQRFVRNPFPRSIRFGAKDLKFPRHYWVEILEGRPDPPWTDATFEVEGEIADDNTVRLKTRHIKRLRLLLRPELFPNPGPIRVLLNGREVFSGDVSFDCSKFEETLAAYPDPDLAYSADLSLLVD